MTKLMAFFLPQFHDDPLNSKWWGSGFTEWVNVKAARTLFDGHRQPRIPAAGYAMLETPEELDAQFTEATAHGLNGFVFYHYWSRGTRLLSKPLDTLLASPEVGADANFSLCWANHAWTRSWKNRSGALDVLLEQEYEDTSQEREEHIDFLVKCFADPRYLRVNGRPLFQVYSPELVPHFAAFASELKHSCKKSTGAECEISGVIKNWQSNWDILQLLDSVTLAQPALSQYASVDIFDEKLAVREYLFSPDKIVRSLPQWVKRILYAIQDRFFNKVSFVDYDRAWEMVLKQMQRAVSSGRYVHLSGFVDFDNTARYGARAKIYRGFTTEKFSSYLRRAYNIAETNDKSGLLFINAWNEWAEGMYLQPDTEFGNARLEAVKAIAENTQQAKCDE